MSCVADWGATKIVAYFNGFFLGGEIFSPSAVSFILLLLEKYRFFVLQLNPPFTYFKLWW